MQFCSESVFGIIDIYILYLYVYIYIYNGPRASILTPNEEEQACSTMFVSEICSSPLRHVKILDPKVPFLTTWPSCTGRNVPNTIQPCEVKLPPADTRGIGCKMIGNTTGCPVLCSALAVRHKRSEGWRRPSMILRRSLTAQCREGETAKWVPYLRRNDHDHF